MKKYLIYLGLFFQLTCLSGNVDYADRLVSIRDEITRIQAQIDALSSRIPEEKDVTLENASLKNTPLPQAVDILKREGSGIDFVLSEEAQQKTVNLQLRNLKLSRIIEFITQQSNLDWVYSDNRIYIADKSETKLPEGSAELFRTKRSIEPLARDLRKASREERKTERSIRLTEKYALEIEGNGLSLFRGKQLVTEGMHHNGSVYFLYENVIDYSSDIGTPPDVPESIYTTPLGNLYHWNPALNIYVDSKNRINGEPIYFTRFTRRKNDDGSFPEFVPDNEVRFSAESSHDGARCSYDLIFYDVKSLDGFLEKYIQRDKVMVVYLHVRLPIHKNKFKGIIHDINDLKHPFYLVVKTSSIGNSTDHVGDRTRRYLELKELYSGKNQNELQEN